MPIFAHWVHTPQSGAIRSFAVRKGWGLLCALLSIFAPPVFSADPPLSFQDEVQELVKEAASQSTIVPESAKIGEGKRSTFTVRETCLKIGAKLSSIRVDECQSSNLQPSGKFSVEGYPILLRDVPASAVLTPDKHNPKPPARLPQARVLLIGGVHGDEYSSISIVFKWMKFLEKNNASLFHWHIVPLVNPDGLLRKQSTRTNANGVDLNRNFPTRDWKEDSADYWVRRTGKDPRRFPGKSPLSEPETSWLFDEIKQFRPNVIVSIHAPFGLLDFDGPPTTPPERLGNIYLSLLGTYPGSLGRYAVESLKLPIITIELPHAGIMPTGSEIETIWSDLLGWMRGHVFDHAASETPPGSDNSGKAANTPGTTPPAPAVAAAAPPTAAAGTAATAAAAATAAKATAVSPGTAGATASPTNQTDSKATATTNQATAPAAGSQATAPAAGSQATAPTASPQQATTPAASPQATVPATAAGNKPARADKAKAQKSKKVKSKSKPKSGKNKRSSKSGSTAAPATSKVGSP